MEGQRMSHYPPHNISCVASRTAIYLAQGFSSLSEDRPFGFLKTSFVLTFISGSYWHRMGRDQGTAKLTMHKIAIKSKRLRLKFSIEPRNVEWIHSFCVGGWASIRGFALYEDNLRSHSTLFDTGSHISMHLRHAGYTSWPGTSRDLPGSVWDLIVKGITSIGNHAQL